MKKSYLFSSLFCFAMLFGVVSCGGDDDGPAGCSVAWATDLQDEAVALANASAAYTDDPSQANCDALKAAYQTYINALKPYGNCTALTGQDRQAWQDFIDELEDEVATVC